ncbi:MULTISPECIES: hypothetical protein [unclassified Burkholderia]|uniref:hypothetical protein n=1 Tax=unclassified Burkholderia TaxID=2613784 RepID=UPI00197E624E|nr:MULTISPECIES: hypothetical protein [unclassified Burkholderia]MBN3769271.1 hypothetical protein [Burkholderia sp. Se-20378]MBN3793985.1 hypothetical protein [Burkholderia sp. Ac-20392]
MSHYENTSVKVKGVGNHVGDTVKVTNNNVTNNMYRDPPNNGGGTQNWLLPIMFLALLVVWFFFRHFEQIESLLKNAIVVVIIPSALASLVAFGRDRDIGPTTLALLPATAAALTAYLLLGIIRDNVPPQILAFAATATAGKFWGTLIREDLQVTLQNGGAIALCVSAIAINGLAGLRAFAATNSTWCGWLWALTWRYSPVRHIWSQLMLLGGALLLTTGRAYELFVWLQEAIRAALT